MNQKENSIDHAKVIPHKNMTDISLLINQTWQLYKEKLFSCITVQLVTIVPALILAIIVAIIALALAPTLNSTTGLLNTILTIVFILTIIFVIIVAILLGSWFQSTLMLAVLDQEKLGTFALYKKGFRYIFAFIWIGIISALVSLPGFAFLIIPGIIISVFFQLAHWTMLDKNQFGFDALAKSKSIISSRWWDILARMIIIGIIIYILNAFIGIIVTPIGLTAGIIGLGWIANIMQGLLSIFVAPLPVIYTYLIYKNLTELRPDDSAPQSSKTWMIILAIVGIIIIIGIILAALAFGIFGTLLSSDFFQNL